MKKAYAAPELEVICFVSVEKLANWADPYTTGTGPSYVDVDPGWEGTDPETKD